MKKNFFGVLSLRDCPHQMAVTRLAWNIREVSVAITGKFSVNLQRTMPIAKQEA